MDRLNATPSDSARAVRARDYLAAAAFYSIVAAAFFLPVVGRLSTALIGDGGDGPVFVWNIWWIQQSLLQGRNPLFCDLIFAPTGAPLIWHTLMPLPSTVMALLATRLPIELAYNLVVLASFPVTGVCAYALGRYVTRDHLASLVGGLVLMLCPYMASKTLGHPNLLAGGLLPLYLLFVLRSTEPGATRPGRRIRLALLGVSGCILFSDYVAVIFAANLTLFVLVWRAWSSGEWRSSLKRLLEALAPALVVGAAYGVIVACYAVAWRYPPRDSTSPLFCPEPLCYALPFNKTSVWSDDVRALGAPGLGGIELACYLGVAVFPLAMMGFWVGRRVRVVRFCAWTTLAFLILSLGPKLLLNREIVTLGGFTAYLPFGLWRFVPVLGSVGQTGRYVVICYALMGVGVAFLVAAIRQRWGDRAVWVSAIVGAALICADYAFRPWITPLPPVARVSDRPGRVLDPRIGNAPTMYYQTAHGKPLIGGYLARAPRRLVECYREDPGMGWLFTGSERPRPNREAFLRSLEDLEITDILMDPDDERGAELERFGLEEIYRDPWVVVRTVSTSANEY